MNLRSILFIVFSFCLMKSFGQQANYKFNNFGNRSILLSGNVTGSVTDLGLVYYNPSRLTEVENTGFAFNARAYQLSSLKLSNFLGEDSRVSSTNFNGIPSMAGGTFDLSETGLLTHLFLKQEPIIQLAMILKHCRTMYSKVILMLTIIKEMYYCEL
jgi:hypothetical protein